MKSRIFLGLFLAMFAICSLSRDVSAATPIRLALLPDIGVPQDKTVLGLDIGIFADNLQEVQGIQWCWIYSGAERLAGIQFAAVNVSNTVVGAQWGFYNQAQSVEGFQLGVINVTGTLKGVQIGLVNIIRTGAPLPLMVIVNANF